MCRVKCKFTIGFILAAQVAESDKSCASCQATIMGGEVLQGLILGPVLVALYTVGDIECRSFKFSHNIC